MDMLMSVCVHVVKACTIKEWNLHCSSFRPCQWSRVLSLLLHCLMLQVALKPYRSTQRGQQLFFFFLLVQAYIRFDTDTNTHSGIRIHLHTVICMREHTVIGTHSVSGSGLFHTRAETYNFLSGFILHGEK